MFGRFNGKYNAKKTVVDGIKFDSKKEAKYYLRLKEMKEKGEVIEFQMQVPYELQPSFKYMGKTVRNIRYVADFVVSYKDGHQEVVDVKGFRTTDYKLKRKMLLYKYQNINFVEV